MTEAIYKAVEEQFESRIKANNIKKGSAKYKHMQAEFFTGAMAAFLAIIAQPEFVKPYDNAKGMPPHWIFPIMTGELIVK